MVECLTVPQLGEDTDVLTAALAYAACGWYVVPIQRGTKHPGSVLGAGWQHRSSRDPGQLVAWLAGTDRGIALHVGRSGAVVFDVDTAGALPEVLAEHLHSAPYQSTRADDPARGHYVFAVPPGRLLGNGKGKLTGGWGEIRGDNGIIVVAPSAHPHAAGRYHWIRCGGVPQLPAELAEMLPDGTPAKDAATDAVVRSFLAEHTGTTNRGLLNAVLSGFARAVHGGDSRHQEAVKAACWTMREAAAGFYPATEAAAAVRTAFLAAVAKTRPGSPRPAGDPLAPGAWTGILAWGIGQARATDPAVTRARVQASIDPASLIATPPRNHSATNGSSVGQHHDGGDGGEQSGSSLAADSEGTPRQPARSSTATTSEAFSDSRMAQILTDDVLDGEFRWCKGLGWLRWTGQRWEEATDETVGEVIRQYALDRFEAVIAHMRTDPGQPVTAAMNGWKSMLSVGRQRAVLTLARGIVECKAADLDADPDILNNPVGMVNLITGVISPHDPAALITKITKGSYRPGYTHPDWTAALQALPPESREWYQARVGQGITGHTAPDGILPILQGSGENGKSLVSTDGVLPALGDYGDVASAKLITANRGTEHSTEMADLRGKRLMIAEEMTESRALDVTAIKRIQDVGTIKARYVHRDNMTFRASHSLFATTNYVPRVDETDHGTWRRLAMLTFPYTFRKPGEPLVSPADRRGDPELKSRIRKGATGQHDAIVTWAVEGALRVTAGPATALAVPPSVAAATRAWRGTADRILGYWTERLVADPQACVLTTELLEDFNTWIEANGHKKWSRETFAPKFGGHGETTRHGVESRRVLNPEGLVRRSPEWVPQAPSARLSVWLGVRWRTYADQHKDDSLPEVPESNKTFPVRAEAGKFPETLAPLAPRSFETPGNGSCEDHPRPPGFRPTTLMIRVSNYLATTNGGVSGSQIESEVEGSPAGIRRAVEVLVCDGYVTCSADLHGVVLHHHQRRYSDLGELVHNAGAAPAHNGAAPAALICPRCRYPAKRLIPPDGLCKTCAYPGGGAPDDDTEETP